MMIRIPEWLWSGAMMKRTRGGHHGACLKHRSDDEMNE
jgi:hypothetical protein